MKNQLRVNRARTIISENETLIRGVCADYRLPPAYLQSVLMMEIPSLNFSDSLADAVVRLNWARYSVTRSFCLDRHTRNPLRKYDSSTGYGQIFSQVAIEAILFGKTTGLPNPGIDGALSPENPEDLKRVWYRLNTDLRFNLSCSALNILHAAHQMTGRLDFAGYSPEETKLIFSRYNGNVRHITAYGEQAYRHYLEYGGQ